ncbi:hypothetical protein BCR33DRAFT_289977 [Rhizoclosmatium globosum]|uniref:Uncharacterized protein n=1 Tax=Rhizoclosmatium globosum TaxID=329046 RepID=A0A1Y2C7C1_9FUNG|nr:hypothetical protein BCR33DRAFT_289977 [Rhizoclosmatium globosum]|eukprot:ORY42930.1 hypothetical protein BCR33DRAFT_289977 [Rhizoclosmatium globosum]
MAQYLSSDKSYSNHLMLWYAKEAELPVEGVKKRLRKKTRPSPSVGVVKSDNSLTNLTTFRLRRVASYLRAVPVNLRHQYLLKLMVRVY